MRGWRGCWVTLLLRMRLLLRTRLLRRSLRTGLRLMLLLLLWMLMLRLRLWVSLLLLRRSLLLLRFALLLLRFALWLWLGRTLRLRLSLRANHLLRPLLRCRSNLRRRLRPYIRLLRLNPALLLGLNRPLGLIQLLRTLRSALRLLTWLVARLDLLWTPILNRLVHHSGPAAIHRLRLLPNLRSRTNGRRWIPICSKPLSHNCLCRSPLIRCIKLLPIPGRCLRMLHLNLHRRNHPPVIHRHIRSRRTRIDALRSVIAHPGVVHDRNVVLINIPHYGRIYPVYLAVVIEVVPLPIPAVIARTRVSKSVINPAVEPDMRAPEPMAETISPAVEAPISRRPKRAHKRRRNPHSRHPVVACRRIAPVARRPLISRLRQFRLLILRQRRRGLIRIQSLLAGIDGSLVLIVVLVICRTRLLIWVCLAGCLRRWPLALLSQHPRWLLRRSIDRSRSPVYRSEIRIRGVRSVVRRRRIHNRRTRVAFATR